MYQFWDPVIEPLLECLQPGVIIEIGSDHGFNTRNLLDFARRTESTLHVIDPLPKYQVEEWLAEYPDTLVFHEAPSLDVLDSIPAPDAVLIDGDHNWHTVFGELRLLEKTAGDDFPLVLFHDVGWPYARRDLYYDPDRIPIPHRHPFRKQGIRPGVRGLVPVGGLNDHLFNAVSEGGPRNGVLTAIEDFIRETSFELEFLVVPGIHDLGILFETDLASRSQSAATFLQRLDSQPLSRMLSLVEALRIESVIAHADTQRELADAKAKLEGLSGELLAAKAKVQSIEEDRIMKAAELEGLRLELKTTEANVAKAQAEATKSHTDVARLRTQEAELHAEVASWVQQYNMLRSRRSVRLALGLARLVAPVFRLIRGSTPSDGSDEPPVDDVAHIPEIRATRLSSPEEAISEAENLYRSYISEVEPDLIADITNVATTSSVRLVVPTPANARSELTLPSSPSTGTDTPVVTFAAGWQHILEEFDSWTEDFIVVLEAGDAVSDALPMALGNADLANSDELPAAYVVDHDWLDEKRNRVRPEFKPGFSPDFLVEHDYVSRAVVFRRRVLADNDLLRTVVSDTPQEFIIRDILLRLWEEGQVIAKIDAVLFHLVQSQQASHRSVDEAVAYAETVLKRRHIDGIVSGLASGLRVRYRPSDEPLVSIMIPFRDRAALLQNAIQSITQLTTYPNYEIVLINNQSEEDETRVLLEQLVQDPRIRVIEFSEKFNYSRANNQAARHANGKYFLFLNNDVRLISPGWLEELVGFAGQPGVGAVGALLYYGDGTIQHAGVVVGMYGFAGHLFARENPLFVPQPWIRHVRNVSAVTGACLCIDRASFEDVGGFDEGFELTGSDVELCLRLMKNGRRNIFVPSVELFHYEKQSRGTQTVPRGDQERSLEKYQPYLQDGDPFWNRNLLLDTTRILPRPWPASDGRDEPLRGEQRLLRTYDATSEDLARNEALMKSFGQNRYVELGTVTWFLPRFDHVYRGGIHTMMRFANMFSARSGTLNRFFVMGGNPSDESTMKESIQDAFPEMRWELGEISAPEEAADLPPSDIAICTLWTTAYALLRYNNCQGKFYLVQDFEPAFFPANSLYGLVEQTYRFGFFGLVNTPGVAEVYRSYGSPGEYFVPGVDTKVFHPSNERREGPTRIVFYGRPSNPRNGFELGLEALTRIKEQYGDAVSIVTAGGTFDASEFGVEGLIDNLGVLPTIRDVAELYRNSDIGLVFMFTKHPSYQPLEYMASGCATVTNFNEANLWLLRDGENALLPRPTVSAVTESLIQLIEDEALRGRIAHQGLETVMGLSWDDELERMLRYVSTGRSRDG